MGLFYRRPLCLFCFVFAITSLGVWQLPLSWTLSLLLTMGLAVLLTVGIMILFPKIGKRALSLVISLIFSFFAVFHLYLAVDLPQQKGRGLADGCNRVALEIVEVESDSYRVRILQIEDQICRIGGTLNVSSDLSFSVGDQILCCTELHPIGDLSRYRAEDGILYSIWLDEDTSTLISRVPENENPLKLLSTSAGRNNLAYRIRNRVCTILNERLGEDVGQLCGGFLMGDTSLLSDNVVRDFRRSGTSHLMAISGMHIAILLGSADWLLRRVYVPKKLRCAIVSLLALLFLFVTGFASSACRSVLMLFSVYLSYLFGEENDSLTALFVSVMVILLLFPYALTDLGLWMSFLATLGLLTVYPHLERKIPKTKHLFLRILRKGFLILMMTMIANLFLLPILWAVFGEISWIAILSNLLLSPLADLMLVGVLPFLVLGGIPYAGDCFGFLMRVVGEFFTEILQFFSRIPYSVLSLRYPFCNLLIPIFTLTMSLLLILRLKHKRWLLLPPSATLLAFVLCLGVYQGAHREPQITTRETKSAGEIVVAEQGMTMSVYDGSTGDYGSYAFVYKILSKSCATEIHFYTVEHYERTEGLRLLLRRTMVHHLILPTPKNGEEARVAAEIYSVAQECGTQVTFQS